ncbi:MAG: hypothetical protein KBT46_01215, partial [Ruminococcus sp.]|nr:hypothetical protein [Candidatus Copronaster equi]
GYSTSSVKINQKMSVSILVIPSGVAQKGTKDEPFIINNSAEMKMLASAHGIYAKLGKNITASYSAFDFYGTLDGAGHSLTVTSQVFRNVYGLICNLNVIVKSNISTAVFGNAHNAKINSVNVELASGNKLIAKTNNTGCLFNIISGKTVIENTTVKSNVELAENCSNIGIFAGNIKGNNVEISNSGSCGNIAIKNNVSASNVANFVGIISGENISVSNCYTSGKNAAGNMSFAGAISNKNVEFNNIYLTKDCKDAVDFTKYSFVDKNQFKVWKFGQNNIAFFTGNSGSFEISKPEIPMIKNSSVSDYKLSFNSTKINATITVNDKIILKVSRPNGVVTVKNEPVTIVNKRTGLSITLIVSNGLEKTKDGRYVISSSYDLFYVSENVEEIGNASFVMNGNIDMSSIKNFAPIGTISNPFTGKFDGNGFTIINLSVNSGAMSGLFGFVNNAEIKNVKLDKANVVSKGSYSGALLGSAKNTKVDTITVTNANVKAQDINSGVLAGSFSGGSIQNINISNSQIISTSNYVGSVAGRIDYEAVLKSVQINKLSVEGSEFISGVVGLCDGKSVITDASVTDSTVKGLSNVSGMLQATHHFQNLRILKLFLQKFLLTEQHQVLQAEFLLNLAELLKILK